MCLVEEKRQERFIMWGEKKKKTKAVFGLESAGLFGEILGHGEEEEEEGGTRKRAL